MVAELQRAAPGGRRFAPRRKLQLGATLTSSGDAVAIHDLSLTGMLIETDAVLKPLDDFDIELPESGTTRAVIMWNSGRYFGCQFASPVEKATISAAILQSPYPALLEFERAPDPSKTAAEASAAADEEWRDDRAPLTTRLRVILGSSLLLWALILWAIGAIALG